jgi:hypothetical protein
MQVYSLTAGYLPRFVQCVYMKLKTLLLALISTLVALIAAELVTRLAFPLPGVRPLPRH